MTAFDNDNFFAVSIATVAALVVLSATILIFHMIDKDKKNQPYRTKEKIALIDACKQNEPSKIGECIRIAQGYRK